MIFINKLFFMSDILNEQLSRIKNLINFKIEDNGLVSEQPVDFTIRPKFWKGAKGIGSGGVRVRISRGKTKTIKRGEPGAYQEVSSDEYEVQTPKDQWDTFLANDGEMTKLMDETSLSIWNQLKSDEDDKGYAVIALEQFNDTYPKFKWTSVIVGNEETFEEQVIKGQEKVYPAVPIKFPNEISPSSNFFKDNYYQVTPLFVETVNTDIIQPLVAQMAELKPPAGKPKAFLDMIDVVSSCSTLPNGPSPDGKTYTFDELSKLRAQTAMNYIIDQLQKIGVLVNESTKKTMDYMGENGDGTSGPSWLKVPQAEKKAKRPEFEKYKKVDIELSVILNTNEEPIKETTPDEVIRIPKDNYMIEFSKPPKGSLRITLPKIKIRWKKRIRKRTRKVNFRTLECTFFD
jgi:hypothetical protein